MAQIDLNLIRTFVTLYEAGSVTAAAERLFVTQPSVSYALARLRELFDDPLFSRSRDGIQPTFVAEQLYATLREALTRIEGAVQSTRQFDPATTERRFRIALSDLGELGFLPLILARLNREAPLAEVEVLPLQVDEVGDWLASGKVDTAICRQAVPGSRSRVLIQERYVCLLSADHPRIGERLELAGYLAERHVVVTRTSGHGIAEDVLQAMKLERRIALRVPHFSVLPKIIPGTDLLTILPAQIARMFVAEGGLKMLELPFAVPAFEVSLHWRASSEQSAALEWFRNAIADAILEGQH
ncbi:LysR family transcriptional regulator [Pseudomonas sp. R3.Fl]|jgi:DNA-binding transcriptional LysR family regulator|uniref:LysR family transcriptional regulator n=1 Tax=Pseudomonas TaxID=286 RepID=UPI000E2FF074|nr:MULTISPECIES: LysR family transcriptional regulator [Pseudomonas]MCL6690844.1 LysR family transcriptional regulator [Pseudomonas sp. R3.Fl]MCP1604858.1 DNA-binding transcriptional LysR family regulator [Pseudomonas citronellolis]MCP1655024.1 DNA-binding transcriptional LysR family regulator [Pseudomonas citronellolis]MCP1725300.1 DNA-binding transcriptional LysR family regulator [Pseudomonas citronellolis]MDN6873457.1 LysR family transcriptional regulator [Pseudomonas citronellolis]